VDDDRKVQFPRDLELRREDLKLAVYIASAGLEIQPDFADSTQAPGRLQGDAQPVRNRVIPLLDEERVQSKRSADDPVSTQLRHSRPFLESGRVHADAADAAPAAFIQNPVGARQQSRVGQMGVDVI